METQDMNFSHNRDLGAGAALLVAIVVMLLMLIITGSILTIASNDANVAGSDFRRTEAFYAAATGTEKMIKDFNDLSTTKINISQTDLNAIAADAPDELENLNYNFNQEFKVDETTLKMMQTAQGLKNGETPSTNIVSGPFAGLMAFMRPHLLSSTAVTPNGEQYKIERNMNSYMIPLFQFGAFSDKTLELSLNDYTLKGRVHSNSNLYLRGTVTFDGKMTTAGEIVNDIGENGNVFGAENVRIRVSGVDVPLNGGSVINGPNFKTTGKRGDRGYHPGQACTNNLTGASCGERPAASWDAVIKNTADGTPNQFGGAVLSRSTGGVALKLPLQLQGDVMNEMIRRKMPGDNDVLNVSRYHTKARIRVLLDDESATCAMPGTIPCDAGKKRGILLSDWTPKKLGADGQALWRFDNAGKALDDVSTAPQQEGGGSAKRVRSTGKDLISVSGDKIPGGANLAGRIYVEIVEKDGVTTRDVTQEILSMGVTHGEPNGIFYLQRPLWAAFVPATFGRNGGLNLADLSEGIVNGVFRPTNPVADGEINLNPNSSKDNEIINGAAYFLNDLSEDFSIQRSDKPKKSDGVTDAVPGQNYAGEITDFSRQNPQLEKAKLALAPALIEDFGNTIVPINVYNRREGNYRDYGLNRDWAYERGMTSVIDVNMKNLARWLDGVYDANLLAGTPAISTNIGDEDGYVVYISDRRGDRPRSEMIDDPSGSMTPVSAITTNGLVDNEDVYGVRTDAGDPETLTDTINSNGWLDPGEDTISFGQDGSGVSKKGTLQKDTNELPDSGVAFVPLTEDGVTPGTRDQVEANISTLIRALSYNNPRNYFRRGVRLFNGAEMITGATGTNRLGETKGITVATEGMLYIWGSYNATGITGQPAGTSTPNVPNSSGFVYTGSQIPASLIADATFQLSRTWFDAMPIILNGSVDDRVADYGVSSNNETSVRAAIINGEPIKGPAGTPDANDNSGPATQVLSHLHGGIDNFNRFLENWHNKRYNYAGSMIIGYDSTQGIGPNTFMQTAHHPLLNLSFDETFYDIKRLPPGTPAFLYVQQTGFRTKIFP